MEIIMKDYTIDEKGKSNYVVNFTRGKNNTYTIYFADGSVFENVEVNDENLRKLKMVQEQQAKRGVENLSVFRNRKTKSGVMTGASAIGSAVAATAVTMIPAVGELLQGQNPLVVGAGIGVITILGAIPAYTKFRRDKAAVKELEKIKYRDEHREDLDAYGSYANALSGLNPDLRAKIKRSKEPFSIIHIDSFSAEDLEKIISNIEREKQFDFIYPEETEEEREADAARGKTK